VSKLSLGVQKVASLPSLPDPGSSIAVLTNACHAVYTGRDSIIGHVRLAEADEMRRRSSAIEEYLRGTEAYPDAQRAGRVLEAAVGEALGQAKNGRPSGQTFPAGKDIEPTLRHEFRSIANGWDKIEPYLETDGLSRAAALRIAKGGHVSANSAENEWYTPEPYIVAARAVMGGIDLDPASTAAANEVVGASRYFTAEQNGLDQPWTGCVWLNPPYARPLIWLFSEKLAEEVSGGNVEQAIALVNNGTETVWFQRLAEVAKAVCFPSGRVKFWHPDRISAPLQGQAVLYFGDNAKRFCSEFMAFGFTAAVVG
jgi:phage N-6-adenine-methyltransferase